LDTELERFKTSDQAAEALDALSPLYKAEASKVAKDRQEGL